MDKEQLKAKIDQLCAEYVEAKRKMQAAARMEALHSTIKFAQEALDLGDEINELRKQLHGY